MSIISRIKKGVKEAIVSSRRYRRYRRYSNQYKSFLKMQHFENKKAIGEDSYVKKWEVLCPRVEPYSYRFYSHFCGYNPNIVPEDIGRTFIEEVLNPVEYRPVYEDKNMFPEIIGKENVARTIVCRINGSNLLDDEYNIASDEL